MIILKRNTVLLLFIGLLSLEACNKSSTDSSANSSLTGLSYGDSILYQKNIGADYLIYPTNAISGSYSAFPDGIEIDDRTGAINLSRSETGLRYRITFTPDGSSDHYSTTVLLAGINYLDAFYFLSKNDTIARPIYNGQAVNAIPVDAGTSFDIGLGCNNEGIAVNANDGKINLMQTIRNGFFGKYPDNGTRKEFEMKYKINDKSQQALNNLKIKIYYFATMDDVTPDLLQLLEDRKGMLLGPNMNNTNGEIMSTVAGIMGIQKEAKPRPPCIFIIGK